MTRAADDFPVIRARLEELRRERIRVAANNDPRRAEGRRSFETEYEDRQIPHGRVSCITLRHVRRFEPRNGDGGPRSPGSRLAVSALLRRSGRR